jgi:hypothetical protein
MPLLDPNALRNVLDDSLNEGRGAEQFRARSSDLAGQVRQLTGEVKQFQTQLLATDIFAPLGVGLDLITRLISGINDLLKAYNELTDFQLGPISGGQAISGAAWTAAGVAGYRRITEGTPVREQVRNMLGRGGDGERGGAEGRMNATIVAATTGRGAAEQGLIAVLTRYMAQIAGITEAEAAARIRDIADESAAREVGSQVITREMREEARVRNAHVGRISAAMTRLEGAINAAGARMGMASAGTAMAGGVGRLGGMAGGAVGALGRFAASPYGLAAAGAGVVGYNLFNERREFEKYFSSRTEVTGRAGGDAASIERAAADLRSAADAFDTRASGFTAFLTSQPRRDELEKNRNLAEQLEYEAARAQAPVDRSSLSAFGTASTTDEISSGLEKLTAQGVGTVDQLDLLIKAVTTLGVTSQEAAQRLSEEAGSVVTAALSRTAGVPAPTTETDPRYLELAGLRDKYQRTPELRGVIERRMEERAEQLEDIQEFKPLENAETRRKVYDAVLRRMQSAKPNAQGTYSDADIEAAAREGAATLGDIPAEIGERFTNNLVQFLQQEANNRIPDPNRLLSGVEATARVQGIAQQSAKAISSPTLAHNTNAQVQRLTADLKAVEAVIAQTRPGEDISALLEERQALQQRLASTVMRQMERDRARLQRPGNTRAQNVTAGRQTLQTAMQAAANAGMVDELIDLMNLADRVAIAHARAQLVKADAAAQETKRIAQKNYNEWKTARAGLMRTMTGAERAAYDETGRQLASDLGTKTRGAAGTTGALSSFDAARGQSDPTGAGLVGDEETAEDRNMARRKAMAATAGRVAQARDRISQARDAMNEELAKSGGAKTVAYWNAVGEWRQANEELRSALVDEANAAIQVLAAKTGGALAGADAALRIASNNLRNAKGPEERSRALAEYYGALHQRNQALLDMARDEDLLSGDITDPVEQGRDAIRDTQRRLAEAQGRGAQDDITRLQAQLRQQQASQWQTEAQQELEGYRTKHELGHITHSAYMGYLKAEHGRLAAMRNRSFAQTQFMYQLEREMQGLAKGLAGQWNLGDIKIPTIYQARRAAAGGGTYGMPNTSPVNQNISIKVDGTDTATVTQVLTSLLGPDAGRNSTFTRKY